MKSPSKIAGETPSDLHLYERGKMELALLDESIRNLVTKLGYIYRSGIMPPTEAEQQRLLDAGAADLRVDLGDRRHYLEMVRDRDSLGATEGSLLLLTLADLGDTVPKVEQQVKFWLDRNVEIQLISEQGVQSSRDRPTLNRWLARLPHELKGRHIAEGHAHNRLNRKPPPGPAPFGYRRLEDTYVLDEQSAELVRDFFDRFLLFGSIRGAVTYFQQEREQPISVTTARRWLTSPVYRGDLKFKDGVTLRDTHPPLLNREEAAQIDRWFRRNSQISRRSASAPRALAGLVVCQTCNSSLRIVQATRKNRDKVYRYLRCPNCCYSINYDRAFQRTIQEVCQQLPERTATLNSTTVESIKNRIELQIESNKKKISGLLPERLSPLATDTNNSDLQFQRYQLEGENAKLSEQREQLPPENLAAIAQAVSIEPFWQSLSESEQRAYLREFIKQIRISADLDIELEFFF